MNHILNLDKKMQKFLLDKSYDSKIRDIFNYGNGAFINKIGDYIKQEGVDSISYIPLEKMKDGHNGFDEVKKRVNIKVGRFFKKLMRKDLLEIFDIKESDLLIYVNIFKSYFNDNISNLKIVDGDEIYKWYLYKNYSGFENGTLWKSCMRYHEKNKFMELYAKNPNKCKLLIYLDDSNKLIARSILWFDCHDRNGNSYNVMDRIYSLYDHNVELFKSWSVQNNFIHKADQSSKSESIFFKDGKNTRLNLSVSLDNNNLSFFPYLDTFKYYNSIDGVLKNYDVNFTHILTSNNGLLVEEELIDEYDNDNDIF